MRKTNTGDCPSAAGRPRCPDRRAAILAAALTLLTEQGFSRMTLDQVARTAGVSKATIHLRWRAKADLAAAALAAAPLPCSVPAPARAQGTPRPAGDPRAELANLLDDFIDALSRRRDAALMGTCLAEEAHTPRLLHALREREVLPRRAALRAVLDEGRAGGLLPADADLEALASALLGACYADHLAGRAAAPGAGRRIVDTVLGPEPESGSGPAPGPGAGWGPARQPDPGRT
ncbi:TetR/AcrR family transcriptional regulator C-terminal ligand-binding domain-containing protein [Streptomyces sp. NPDC086766]|uniref:TetR/AcrR family transcriptional regulator n=1 Tax=Streptomyces sp. NPDC086766 TaxID=3365754 RepID=UPI0037F4DE57